MKIVNDVTAFINTVKQLKELMSEKQQHQVGIVFLFVVLGAAFETLGVAAILPFVQAVMSPNILWENYYIKQICSYIGINNNISLIIALGITISAIYIIKNVFLLYVTYRESKFKADLVYDLSCLMLNCYLKRPYTFFLNTNSAEMVRGVTEDIASVNEMITAVFKILSLGLMMFGIALFLLIQNPAMALGIFIIAFLTFFVVVVLVKKKTKSLGEKKLEIGTGAYKCAYQALNGIKEINILHREEYFLESYSKIAREKRGIDVAYACLSASPERIIEAIFLCGVIGITCTQVLFGSLSGDFVAGLAAFAVGAMRILPSLSTMTTRMTQLMYLKPALNSICLNIQSARDYQSELYRNNQKYCDENIEIAKKDIIVDNISWNYPDSEFDILDHASMTVAEGDCIGIIGRSGAGKTTLADILLGLLRPREGGVYIDNIDIYSIPKAWSRIVGYVPQMVYLLDDTIRNNVVFGANNGQVDNSQVWKALEKAQLKEFVNNLPNKLDTLIGERGVKLSGGQRQRIAIARALYLNPEILVFDEATAALDNETEKAVMDAINTLKSEKTLIIIAHRLNTIERCDKIYEVKDGKILEVRNDIMEYRM